MKRARLDSYVIRTLKKWFQDYAKLRETSMSKLIEQAMLEFKRREEKGK